MDRENLHIGTSGWHYQHWRRRFYPDELKTAEWLRYYSEIFNCVEVNTSFYRLLQPSVIKDWVCETPANFQFAVKASRMLTHMKKLRDCEEALDKFLSSLEGFGDKLGPLLFQLPPHWQFHQQRLEGFLEILPKGYHYSFEFRDPSWHNEAIYSILSVNNVAFCQYDLNGFQSPSQTTSDIVYVRLHGPENAYTGSYSTASLRAWSRRLLRWRGEGKSCYLFFDNDQNAHAANNARLLRAFCEPS